MPDWLVDLGLILSAYGVIAAVVAWGVAALILGADPVGPGYSESEGGEE